MSETTKRGSGSLTIRQLEVFAVASRFSTFSEAARKLDISQPTLSNMIAKLEEQLGLSLFDRTTRTLSLTAEGERLALVAQDLVRGFQASLRSIHDTARRRHGSLSMAVLPSVASAIAPQAIKLFLEEYPDFDIALHDTARQDGLVAVVDRVVDFGILTSAPKGSELRTQIIYTDMFHIVCHPDSPLARKSRVDWSDLADFPLILTGTAQIRRDIESAWTQAGSALTPIYEVTNIMTGLSLVMADLGVTVLPRLYFPDAMAQLLKSIPLATGSFNRDIEIVHRVDRVLPPSVEHMIACFKTCFAEFEKRDSKPLSKPKKQP